MAKIPYDPEIGEIICQRTERGETYQSIEKDKGMPSRAVMQRWRREYPEFAAAYNVARQGAADYLADEIREISNILRYHPDMSTQQIKSYEAAIKSMTWLAEKFFPQVYGNKTQIEHSGGLTFTNLSDGDLLNEMKLIIDASQQKLIEHNEFAQNLTSDGDDE